MKWLYFCMGEDIFYVFFDVIEVMVFEGVVDGELIVWCGG